PTRRLPRDQPGGHELVRLRPRDLRAGRRRPGPGRAGRVGRAATTPPGSAAAQLGARQRRPAPLRRAPAGRLPRAPRAAGEGHAGAMRVAVVGTGYVGLTTGAYLAHLGHEVVCADVVPEKIERLNRGDVPILEAGLDELVREGLDTGRLSFVLGAPTAVEGAEFVFLCVQTPQ